MHELAMADGLLSLILDAAGGRTVQSIRLRVGRLHAVVPDSLQFSFQLLGEDTPASGAVVEVEEVPAAVRCHRCAATSECPSPPFQCRQCGDTDVSVVAGAELCVEEVRLEDGTSITPDRHDALSTTLAAHLAEEHGL